MALATAATASSWPITRSWRTSSMRTSLAISPSMRRDDGDAGPLGDDLGDVLGVDLLLEHPLRRPGARRARSLASSTWRSSSGMRP